jgi:phage FluMu gp28-like protein
MMALCHTLFNASQHIQDAIDRATLSTISPEDKAFLDASLQAVAQRVAQRNTEKIAVLAAYEAKYAAQTHAPLPTLEQLHAEFKAVPETSLPIDVKKELAEAMTDAGIVPPPEPKPIPPEELDINTVI